MLHTSTLPHRLMNIHILQCNNTNHASVLFVPWLTSFNYVNAMLLPLELSLYRCYRHVRSNDSLDSRSKLSSPVYTSLRRVRLPHEAWTFPLCYYIIFFFFTFFKFFFLCTAKVHCRVNTNISDFCVITGRLSRKCSPRETKHANGFRVSLTREKKVKKNIKKEVANPRWIRSIGDVSERTPEL